MGWRYPKSELRNGDVVAIDSLNDGFAPFAQEGQGRLNEQNLDAGALPTTTVTGTGPGQGSFRYISSEFLEVGACGTLFDTVGTNLLQEVIAPTQGAMLTPLCVQPSEGSGTPGGFLMDENTWDSGNYPPRPQTEGIPTNTEADNVQFFWFAWTPPDPDIWYTIGSGSAPWFGEHYPVKCPMEVSQEIGRAESDEILFVSASLQCVCLNNSGASFGIFINGALVAESMVGAGDPSNDPTFRQGGAVVQLSERGYGSKAAGSFTRYMGFPVCMDAVLPVPSGPFRVEIKVKPHRRVAGLAIGSRELVVWAMRG